MDLGYGLSVGASTATVFSFLVVAGTAIAAKYRRTIGSRRHIASQLNQLACGVTREYVNGLLGVPAFHRRLTDEVEEFVYRTPHAWVQILTNMDGDVARVAITATDRKFKFRTTCLTFRHLSIRLLKDSFTAATESGSAPEGVSISIGARRFSYAESFYFGNPGNYQHYVLAYNDAGSDGDADFGSLSASGITSSAEGALLRPSESPAGSSLWDNPAVQSFRRNSRPNTLIWSGPLDQGEILAVPPLGVDKDYVRVLYV